MILADLARFATQPVPVADELLLIGRRHVRSNNSWMHNYHRLVKGKPRHQLLMHPDDLARRQLSDGQRVRVSSRIGMVEVEVMASLDMMPGVVSLPYGWGHGRPGVQMSIASGQPGASANDLTDERQLDEPGNAALNGVASASGGGLRWPSTCWNFALQCATVPTRESRSSCRGVTWISSKRSKSRLPITPFRFT